VVDQVKRADLRPEQGVELGLVGHERLRRLVEAQAGSGAPQHLDLRPVVIRRGEDLVAGPQANVRERPPEAVASPAEHGFSHAVFVQSSLNAMSMPRNS
jgi:hypothetical protein